MLTAGKSSSSVKNWAEKILYQAIFAAVLSAFLGALISFHGATMDNFRPTRFAILLGKNRRELHFRTLSSLNTPGLAFRPQPEDPLSTLIHFQHGYAGNWKHFSVSRVTFGPNFTIWHFAEELEELLGRVRPRKASRQQLEVQVEDANRRAHEMSRLAQEAHRLVDGHRLHQRLTNSLLVYKQYANVAEHFGYPRGRPCVLLKV